MQAPPNHHTAFYNGGRCAYCGIKASSWDHFVPKKYRPDEIENILIAACRECNSTAGAKIFESFLEKQYYIQRRLLYKYRYEVEDDVELARRVTWTNDLNPQSATLATIRLHLGVFGKGFVQQNVKKNLKNESEMKLSNS